MSKFLDYVGLTRLISKLDDKFVPYSGATKDVDIGTHTIAAGDITVRGNNTTLYIDDNYLEYVCSDGCYTYYLPDLYLERDEDHDAECRFVVTVGGRIKFYTDGDYYSSGMWFFEEGYETLAYTCEGVFVSNFGENETMAHFPTKSGGGTETIAYQSWVQAQGYKTSDLNYYPKRSYTSGLQISTYVGSSYCALYVPYATSSQYGVVKTAANRTSAITTTQGGTTSNRYYGVEADSNGKLFVNVPWSSGSGIIQETLWSGAISNFNNSLLSAIQSFGKAGVFRIITDRTTHAYYCLSSYDNYIPNCEFTVVIDSWTSSTSFGGYVTLIDYTYGRVTGRVYISYLNLNNSTTPKFTSLRNLGPTAYYEHRWRLKATYVRAYFKIVVPYQYNGGMYSFGYNYTSLANALYAHGFRSVDTALPATGCYNGHIVIAIYSTASSGGTITLVYDEGYTTTIGSSDSSLNIYESIREYDSSEDHY